MTQLYVQHFVSKYLLSTDYVPGTSLEPHIMEELDGG